MHEIMGVASMSELRGNADSMYYMLTDIKSAIEKLKEDIEVEL